MGRYRNLHFLMSTKQTEEGLEHSMGEEVKSLGGGLLGRNKLSHEVLWLKNRKRLTVIQDPSPFTTAALVTRWK